MILFIYCCKVFILYEQNKNCILKKKHVLRYILILSQLLRMYFIVFVYNYQIKIVIELSKDLNIISFYLYYNYFVFLEVNTFVGFIIGNRTSKKT